MVPDTGGGVVAQEVMITRGPGSVNPFARPIESAEKPSSMVSFDPAAGIGVHTPARGRGSLAMHIPKASGSDSKQLATSVPMPSNLDAGMSFDPTTQYRQPMMVQRSVANATS